MFYNNYMSEDISLIPESSSVKAPEDKKEKKKKEESAPVLVGPKKEKKGFWELINGLFKK
jgi:hypothetical protein